MHKTFRIISYALFLVNFLMLFSNYASFTDFSFMKLVLCLIVVSLLLIISIIQVIRKNKIIEDEKYNFMFLFVNIIVLIILLRDKFDVMIPLGSANDVTYYSSSTSGLFIDYNLVYISTMYVGVLLYNLLNQTGKRKKF